GLPQRRRAGVGRLRGNGGERVLSPARRRRTEVSLLVLPPVAMLAAVAGDAPVAVRSCVAAVFFLESPGLAVLAPARFRWELELAVLGPSSLAVTTVVSVALFFAHARSPLSAVAILAVCCAAGALGVAA